MEDTDSSDTRRWIETQNKLTFDILEGIPEYERIRQCLPELWDFPKTWAPVRRRLDGICELGQLLN